MRIDRDGDQGKARRGRKEGCGGEYKVGRGNTPENYFSLAFGPQAFFFFLVRTCPKLGLLPPIHTQIDNTGAVNSSENTKREGTIEGLGVTFVLVWFDW